MAFLSLTLVDVFVTSQIDSCNSLLYVLPSYLIQRLQYALNSAARLTSMSPKADHITPLLIELHWLPVEQCINFKVLLFTYKIVNGLAPMYPCELLAPYVPRRDHRSADKLLFCQPSLFHVFIYIIYKNNLSETNCKPIEAKTHSYHHACIFISLNWMFYLVNYSVRMLFI